MNAIVVAILSCCKPLAASAGARRVPDRKAPRCGSLSCCADFQLLPTLLPSGWTAAGARRQVWKIGAALNRRRTAVDDLPAPTDQKVVRARLASVVTRLLGSSTRRTAIPMASAAATWVSSIKMASDGATPFAAGEHGAMVGAFEILGFPEPVHPDVVYLENRANALFLEDPDDIAQYVQVFDHLTATALSPQASRAMLGSATEEFA